MTSPPPTPEHCQDRLDTQPPNPSPRRERRLRRLRPPHRRRTRPPHRRRRRRTTPPSRRPGRRGRPATTVAVTGLRRAGILLDRDRHPTRHHPPSRPTAMGQHIRRLISRTPRPGEAQSQLTRSKVYRQVPSGSRQQQAHDDQGDRCGMENTSGAADPICPGEARGTVRRRNRVADTLRTPRSDARAEWCSGRSSCRSDHRVV